MSVQAHCLRVDAHRKAKQLRQMKDGQVDWLFRRTRCGGLKAVKVEMAERAGRDHCVGPASLGVQRVVSHHLHRVRLVDGQYWEAATERFAGEVHYLRADGLDDSFEGVLTLRVLVESQHRCRSNYVASVKGGHLETRQGAHDQRLQFVDANVLDNYPEEMSGVYSTFVFKAFFGEVRVDLF